MKKLSFRYSQKLIGLGTIFLMILAVIGRLGVVHASPSFLSDPPVNQVAVKLKSWVSINTILSRYNATQVDVITETNLYILQLPSRYDGANDKKHRHRKLENYQRFSQNTAPGASGRFAL